MRMGPEKSLRTDMEQDAENEVKVKHAGAKSQLKQQDHE